MLTPSEVRESIDYQQANDDDEPGLLKLLDHFARMYSTDSDRESMEAALREAGFESLGAIWLKGMLEARHWDDEGVWEIVNNKTDDCFTFSTVGELLHLVAAAEMAQEVEATNDN